MYSLTYQWQKSYPKQGRCKVWKSGGWGTRSNVVGIICPLPPPLATFAYLWFIRSTALVHQIWTSNFEFLKSICFYSSQFKNVGAPKDEMNCTHKSISCYETPILSRLYYILLLTRATAIFNYGKLLWRLPWLSFARETFCTSSSPEIRNYSCKARKKSEFSYKNAEKKYERNVSKLVAKFGGSANLWREIYWICIISMPRCAVIFGKLSSFFFKSSICIHALHCIIVFKMVTAGP